MSETKNLFARFEKIAKILCLAVLADRTLAPSVRVDEPIEALAIYFPGWASTHSLLMRVLRRRSGASWATRQRRSWKTRGGRSACRQYMQQSYDTDLNKGRK